MKKVLLSLGVLFSAGVMAQSSISQGQEFFKLSEEEQTMVDAELARFKARSKKSTAGGVIAQHMSHAEVADQLFGSQLDNFISPIFQDSTVIIDFGTPRYVDANGYAATFDLTSEAFDAVGIDRFDDSDNYTIDSLIIGGIYDRVNQKSTTHVGDTLVVDVVYGAPTDASVFTQGLSFGPSTWPNVPNSQPITPVAFTGSPAQGWAGDVSWSGKVTFKKALTPADTNTALHRIYTNGINIPAGQIVGVVARFKTGESYSLGDTYFSGSGGTTSATLNSFRVLQLASTDGSAYFFEEVTSGATESFAGAGPLFPDQRYSASNSFFVNQGASTAVWYVYVTGTSTVSLKENNALTEVKLYPNPTNGNVTLEVAQGGTYTVEVVNMVGQSVHSEIINVNGGEKINRDFSSLVKGIYLVNIKGEGSSNTMKLTIK